MRRRRRVDHLLELLDGVLRCLEERLQYFVKALTLKDDYANDDDDDDDDCSWLHSSIHTQSYCVLQPEKRVLVLVEGILLQSELMLQSLRELNSPHLISEWSRRRRRTPRRPLRD